MQRLKVMMSDSRACYGIVAQSVIAAQPLDPLRQKQRHIPRRRRSKGSAPDIDLDRSQFTGTWINLIHYQAVQFLNGFSRNGALDKLWQSIERLGVVRGLQIFAQRVPVNRNAILQHHLRFMQG
jgi:hypothetical protein